MLLPALGSHLKRLSLCAFPPTGADAIPRIQGGKTTPSSRPRGKPLEEPQAWFIHWENHELVRPHVHEGNHWKSVCIRSSSVASSHRRTGNERMRHDRKRKGKGRLWRPLGASSNKGEHTLGQVSKGEDGRKTGDVGERDRGGVLWQVRQHARHDAGMTNHF